MSNSSNIFSISNLFWSGNNGDITCVAGTLQVSGISRNAVIASGISFHRTLVNSTPYTGLSTDYILGCLFSTGTSGVIVLPSGFTNSFVIKDESGTAGIANIRVSGLPNIDGASSFTLNTNYQSITVYGSPNGWRII